MSFPHCQAVSWRGGGRGSVELDGADAGIGGEAELALPGLSQLEGVRCADAGHVERAGGPLQDSAVEDVKGGPCSMDKEQACCLREKEEQD